MSIFYKIAAPVFLAILITGCDNDKKKEYLSSATIYVTYPDGGFAEGIELKIRGGKYACVYEKNEYGIPETNKKGIVDLSYLTAGKEYTVEATGYRPKYIGYTSFVASNGDQDVILILSERKLEEIEVLEKRVRAVEEKVFGRKG